MMGLIRMNCWRGSSIMGSFREEPIPPYYVIVESDGCHRGNVDLPQARGTVAQCVEFISNHLPPHGCEFGIVHVDSGRQVSFMIPPATVARRVRLLWQDME